MLASRLYLPACTLRPRLLRQIWSVCKNINRVHQTSWSTPVIVHPVLPCQVAATLLCRAARQEVSYMHLEEKQPIFM